ncbi:TetR/AcrR family transcriptional regulator [Frankia sp. AiPa1]|uniref:TetR/AcrR family transcriptional regulator n=1 Tax=Frankia sp. AiPa1 TaxID=573492 RepID=UPI00202B1116|nr:TetR/AcrR family transcriptional regulator [Frankia sp. AiPa1]MCL9761331.1 TetR/AcrR family transcriptional regulator [Frankia sp. AiPa1]
MPGDAKSPGDARPPGDTRSRILAVAVTLFGEQGYAGTSVRDISERLGLTKAALYYHFPSKETILDALLEPFMLELGRLADLIRQSPPPSPETLIERIAEVMTGPGGVLLVLVDDPSVIHRRIGRQDLVTLQRLLVQALAGPNPSGARLLRAHCAIGALKAGVMGRALEQAIAQVAATQPLASAPLTGATVDSPPCSGPTAMAVRAVLARMQHESGELVTAAERREIVAAALAALGSEPPVDAPDQPA